MNQVVPASVNELSESIRADGLNLFLGAGVSASAGLPSWEELTHRMIDRAWPVSSSSYFIQNQVTARVIRDAGPVEAMRLVRHKFGESFLGELRLALYADYRAPSPLIDAIVNLRCIHSVCSYNFDDLLEQALAIHKRPFTILTPGDLFPSEGQSPILTVAHPHGLLPMFSEPMQVPSAIWHGYVEGILGKATADVVITEDDFHALYSDSLGWSNLVQIRALLARPSLFVGCSLADPNVRRLLSITRNFSPCPHYAIFLHPFSSLPDQTGWAGLVRDPLEAVKTQVYEAVGVKPVWVGAHDEIPGLLEDLDRLSHANRE